MATMAVVVIVAVTTVVVVAMVVVAEIMALGVAEDAQQKIVIEKLIRFYKNGDLKDLIRPSMAALSTVVTGSEAAGSRPPKEKAPVGQTARQC